VSFDPDNPMLMVKTALELSPTEWKQYPLPQQSITPEVQARWNKAWELIPELARMLRDEFGATKIKVFGSAISVDYFSDGSDIDIAAWDIPIAQYLSSMSSTKISRLTYWIQVFVVWYYVKRLKRKGLRCEGSLDSSI
jgi:uncharacterized protein